MTDTSDEKKIVRRLVEVVLRNQQQCMSYDKKRRGIAINVDKLVDAVMEELKMVHA